MSLILPNQIEFHRTLAKIKSDGHEKLHVLADFDCTITKLHGNSGNKIPGLMMLLEYVKDGLSEVCIEELREYFIKYHPIERDPNCPLEEKKEKMLEWWTLALKSLVKHGLSQKILWEIARNQDIKVRNGIINFLKFLHENNIPLVIISASAIGIKSIEYFLRERGLLFPNISIVSNDFEWNENGIATGYKKPIIHSFNKGESILERNFPDVFSKVKRRTNVVFLGDSLGDHHMVDGFNYENLLGIGFLNEKVEENVEEYIKRYNMIITGDSEGEELVGLFS